MKVALSLAGTASGKCSTSTSATASATPVKHLKTYKSKQNIISDLYISKLKIEQ